MGNCAGSAEPAGSTVDRALVPEPTISEYPGLVFLDYTRSLTPESNLADITDQLVGITPIELAKYGYSDGRSQLYLKGLVLSSTQPAAGMLIETAGGKLLIQCGPIFVTDLLFSAEDKTLEVAYKVPESNCSSSFASVFEALYYAHQTQPQASPFALIKHVIATS